jgi:hypothetical protein
MMGLTIEFSKGVPPFYVQLYFGALIAPIQPITGDMSLCRPLSKITFIVVRF